MFFLPCGLKLFVLAADNYEVRRHRLDGLHPICAVILSLVLRDGAAHPGAGTASIRNAQGGKRGRRMRYNRPVFTDSFRLTR